MVGPLNGLKAVDLTSMVSDPVAAMMLIAESRVRGIWRGPSGASGVPVQQNAQ